MTLSSAQGLSSDEAARRLSKFGPNAVDEPPVSRLTRVAQRFWEPVPWMLEAAIVLQMMIGEYAEALIIAALLIFNVALGLLQEGRADAALAVLKSKLALNAYVKRDSRWIVVPVAKLVPGDVVNLSLGSVVPADVRILSGNVLLDQSMLTGESVPIEAGAEATTYAGALVRRGGATAVVTETGPRTYFGRTAELVRVAHADSGEQKAVLGVVRNLAVFNGAIVILLVGYAHSIAMPVEKVIPLVLTALLASIPVALPATFSLTAALAAQTLARRGVLLTRLSAIHEAATADVLCADKTGTLTRNELAVTAIRPLKEGIDEDDLLALAALASSESASDPVDAAIHAKFNGTASKRLGATVVQFTPFDPAAKISEALIADNSGTEQRVVKGAPAAIAALTEIPQSAEAELKALTQQGLRVLAVASGPSSKLTFAGLIGLSDPPRSDSKTLLNELRMMGIRTIMVTGDAASTAAAVAHEIEFDGAVSPAGTISERVAPEDYSIYAGVFPEDKFRLVKAFQRGGHTVAMCGDGANDAPALRQAQLGIAVSTATDVAKSAASIVLTEPGLAGIVDAVKEGRSAFQRLLTYTLNALVKKIEIVLFLGVGLIMTGHPVLTPMFMALLLVTGDFITMALTADRAVPSAQPDRWRMQNITAAAIILGLFKLMFSVAALAAGKYLLRLAPNELQTLSFIAIVFGGQATVYVFRERGRMWRSRPSNLLVLSSILDTGIASTLAIAGLAMAPLSAFVVLSVLVAATAFAFLLDPAKIALFSRLRVV